MNKLRIPVIFQDYEYEEDPNAIEGLPASAADLLDKPYDDGFNCDQQDAGYGYYADTLNDCKVRGLWKYCPVKRMRYFDRK